jgi:hypothetical protein
MAPREALVPRARLRRTNGQTDGRTDRQTDRQTVAEVGMRLEMLVQAHAALYGRSMG